ncbi:PAS domain-containing protein [Rhizobium sp. TH2]|nr:PAS domain-containing protein [Rhizobium sp. TH2]
MRDDLQRVSKWFVVGTDVDDFRRSEEIHWKRAEEALQISKNNLGLIINTFPVMAWSAGPDGSAEYFNQQYLNYVGLSLGEQRDWDWTAAMSEYWDLTVAIHPDDVNILAATWRAILASGQSGEAEARLRRYDGKYRWFLFRVNPLLDAAGSVVKWYGTCTDFDDQKRAEEALRESERNFKLTIDTIPALAWTARPDGSVEFINQHYLDYLGLSAENAQGWGWTSAVHPDDQETLKATWQAIIASGKQGESEARLRRFDGEFRWFLFRVSPLLDASGNILSWYGVNADIDDRKRAETNLASEKHLLEMIVSGSPLRDVLGALCRMVEELAPDCFCDVHPMNWSDQTIEYSVSSTLPKTYTDLIAGLSVRGDDLPCAVAARQKVQVVTEDFETDSRWQVSDLRTHALQHGLRSVWSTPICAKDGRVLGTFCVYQRSPATPSAHHQNLIAHASHIASIAIERSRTEAALKRSETLLAEGQRLSATGTFSWRVDTDEITFSEELHNIFEFDAGTAITLELFRTRVHPEDMSLVAAQLDRVRAGHDYSGYEIRLMMPDNRVKYLRTFGQVICHQDGRLECLAAVQDVTASRLADEALGKARSELVHVARITSLGALTASIAHEVNQPLSGIITNAGTCLRMLAADPPNMDGARETARRTIRDGNRAADVIKRLRALFSKRTTVRPVDLNAAVREVIELLWSDLQANRVVLRTAFADNLPFVSGDRVQLQQVIMNLLRNATDAMGDVGDRPRRLLVSTELDEDDHVRLSVQDAGVGFRTEDLGRLFDAFYTTKSDGMGIGLFVSRSIIENHSGRLWASSSDGAGATFSFSVPTYSMDQAPAQNIDAARTSLSALPNGLAETL